MKKRYIIPFILLLTSVPAFSQEVRLEVSDKPLNVVLNSLNVEISFDDKALSNYSVSLSKTFADAGDAINYLLNGKPFQVEKVGNVFVVSPVAGAGVARHREMPAVQKHILTGELTDQSTGEPLPYAYIQTGNGVAVTGESGVFTIVETAGRPVRIQVHYLGFETLDTALNIGKHRLSLTPAAVALGEVTVSPSPSSMLMQSGKTSGEMRVNHRIARYLPGSADNSVFNLLRMLPGVRASGEPSDDLIVWGSDRGESQLIYDGFTIFGMKSVNDQIGAVNPYMVKDIRLMKGGYDASHGSRIGAIAEVTAGEGDFGKPSVKANVSNCTANLFASVPVKKTAALSTAYRQTFYNLYDDAGLTGSGGKGRGRQTPAGIFVSPEYNFRDLNLKYAGRTSGSDRYSISLYGADDHFKFSVKQQEYEVDAREENRQYGVSANYNRVWNNGSGSKIHASYSGFAAAIDHVSRTSATPLEVFHVSNTVEELSLSIEHRFNIGGRQTALAGGKWQRYAVGMNGADAHIDNLSLYVTDNIRLGKLSLNAGVRADMTDKIYVQPRISARYVFSDEWTATASAGLYRQFLARTPFVYGEQGYQIIWNLHDSTYLSSAHALAGWAYSNNGWLFSMEGYLKKNSNELYYVDNSIKAFDNTIWGTDIHIKKAWRKQTFFASYSLVNAGAPQKSTGQEIKSGAIASFKAFHFSVAYIYGAGFPVLSTAGRRYAYGQENEHGNGNGNGQGGGNGNGNGGNKAQQHSDTFTAPYSRLDASLAYRFELKTFRIQAGVSILNIFDTDNVKYSYHLTDRNSVFNIYAKATPRTPIVFFEIIF